MITPAHDQRIARAALLLAGEIVRFQFESDAFDVLAEFRERLADPTIMAGIRALAESERKMEAAQLNHHRGGEEQTDG